MYHTIALLAVPLTRRPYLVSALMHAMSRAYVCVYCVCVRCAECESVGLNFKYCKTVYMYLIIQGVLR